jgi:hypothetical protein
MPQSIHIGCLSLPPFPQRAGNTSLEKEALLQTDIDPDAIVSFKTLLNLLNQGRFMHKPVQKAFLLGLFLAHESVIVESEKIATIEGSYL